MRNWVLLAILLVICIFNLAPAPVLKDINPHAVVRLHDARDDRFFCTGFIISDNQLLTAAHCVGLSIFGMKAGTRDRITLKNHKREVIGEAAIHDFQVDSDLAILKGDFSNLSKVEITTDPVEIDNAIKHEVISCGYPYGEELVCSKMDQIEHYVFILSARGWLYPGMSGGPVFSQRSGKVIALNSARRAKEALLIPLTGIFSIIPK